MLDFLMLMVPIFLIALGCLFFFKGKIVLLEFGGLLAIPAALFGIGLAIASWQATADNEVWNGRIAGKARQEVSCRHSYECNCVNICSGSGKNESCTRVCQTCYEHSYDVDWNYSATTGETGSIDTIDRQGLKMPPRWGTIYPGEPFSSAHSYTNYILANPDSVLLGGRGDVEHFKDLLPPENVAVYDYYRHEPVVNMGVPNIDTTSWTWLLKEINGDLGPAKQVNVVLVFVKTDDPRYTLALKDKWIGGKKNDAIVVIGSLDGHKIAFADIVTWSPNSLYSITLKDDLTKIGTLDKRDDIVQAIRTETGSRFTRMHMKDYQYLMRSFQPSGTAIIILLVLGLLTEGGLAYFFIVNDLEDTELENESWSDKRLWKIAWPWPRRSQNRYSTWNRY